MDRQNVTSHDSLESAPPSKPRGRNSSIEILRLLAMLLIVFDHMVTTHHNAGVWGGWIYGQPLTVKRIAFESLSLGRVGVVIFFAISAWFLCERSGDLHDSLKRVWLLEREVLFWSVALLAGQILLAHPVSVGDVLRSLMPLCSGLWWYPSSYALFILLCPFLTDGLRKLGQNIHRNLCGLLLVWLVLCLIPWFSLDLSTSGNDVAGMLILYVLISYLRWYMEIPSRRSSWIMIIGGYAFLLVSQLTAALVAHSASGAAEWGAFYRSGWQLPMVAIGLGIVFVAIRHEFHSVIVNYCASSALSIYLITCHPNLFTFLWTKIVDFTTFYNQPFSFFYAIGLSIVVMSACILADSVRRLIFRFTIDRHKGELFEKIWQRSIGKI